MGCTRRTAHCRVTSRGRKGGNVSKNSQRTKTIFRQIAAYATLRGSETMGCTRRTAHCRVTSRGRRGGDFTENSPRTKTYFSSDCCIYNSARERDDGLYSAYCPLSSDKQRTQRRRFHGKSQKNHEIHNNTQQRQVMERAAQIRIRMRNGGADGCRDKNYERCNGPDDRLQKLYGVTGGEVDIASYLRGSFDPQPQPMIKTGFAKAAGGMAVAVTAAAIAPGAGSGADDAGQTDASATAPVRKFFRTECDMSPPGGIVANGAEAVDIARRDRHDNAICRERANGRGGDRAE